MKAVLILIIIILIMALGLSVSYNVSYLDTSSHTIKIRGKSENSVGKMRRLRIVAIRMTDDFDFHSKESNSESSTSSSVAHPIAKIKINNKTIIFLILIINMLFLYKIIDSRLWCNPLNT